MYYIQQGIRQCRQGSGSHLQKSEKEAITKYNEITKLGNMFSGHLGGSEFVPWSSIYLGRYSFWGDGCYPGTYCGTQSIILPASNYHPDKVQHKLTETTKGPLPWLNLNNGKHVRQVAKQSNICLN